jgi:hypothetical protein
MLEQPAPAPETRRRPRLATRYWLRKRGQARLATTKTRLQSMPGDLQERLINWGYAVCDAAMRTHLVSDSLVQPRFPYPEHGVG